MPSRRKAPAPNTSNIIGFIDPPVDPAGDATTSATTPWASCTAAWAGAEVLAILGVEKIAASTVAPLVNAFSAAWAWTGRGARAGAVLRVPRVRAGGFSASTGFADFGKKFFNEKSSARGGVTAFGVGVATFKIVATADDFGARDVNTLLIKVGTFINTGLTAAFGALVTALITAGTT